MSVDETLMCSFQILKPSEKKAKYQYGPVSTAQPANRPGTPQRPGSGAPNQGKKKWPSRILTILTNLLLSQQQLQIQQRQDDSPQSNNNCHEKEKESEQNKKLSD